MARIREDLGIKGKVSAVPYKLLRYGEGGHFKAHRDTEKLDSMFGSLIIALPSAHEGGRLLIRHDGREIEVDFSREEHRHDFQHAAFFADCEHEVEPVRSGFRCCLAYNLRLDDGDPHSLNLPLDSQARTLVAPLVSLKSDFTGELTAVLLEHGYTEAVFSLHKLKGDDRVRAQALFAAAKEAGFTAHLGLVTQYQMGELDDYHYRSSRRHWDDDDDEVDGTMGEIYDESLTIARLPENLPQAGSFHYRRPSDEGPFTLTLISLAMAGAREFLVELLPGIPDHAWLLCDASPWEKLHQAFGIAPFASLHRRLLQGDPEAQRQILFPALDALLARKDGEALALEMAVSLARLKPGSPNIPGRGRMASLAPLGDQTEVRTMLTASRLFKKPTDRTAALTFVLSARSLDVVRQVLAPVLLAKPALASGDGIGREVLDFSKDLLKREIDRALVPFPDWTRPCPAPPSFTSSRMRSEEAALRDLAAFMADPTAQSHDFRKRQDIRDTLTNFISSHHLDLDHTTIRKGSPHTLSCTKNEKSFQRALSLRAKDEELLGILSAI